MSFRGAERNLPDIIRSMQDEIQNLKRSVGQNRQNTVHLGQWVIEAEGDKKLKMVNLETGEVTYVGDQSVPFVNSKEWSFAGIVAPTETVVAPAWCCPYPTTLTHVVFQFQTAPTVPYTVHTRIGDGYTADTTTIAAGRTKLLKALNLELVSEQNLYPVMDANSTGDGTNFSVTYWYNGVFQGEL